MQKQIKTLIISVVAFAILAVSYVFVILPIVNAEEPVETTAPVETQAGEVVGVGDRIQIYPQVERAQMKSIQVINDYGTYTFFRDKDNTFKILGAETLQYDQEKFASLVTSTGYTLSMTKVETLLEPEEYGLVEVTRKNGTVYKPAKYILTTLDDQTYHVLVGNSIVTGAGYYVQLEGRKDVYIIEQSIGTTVLAPIEDLVAPLVSLPIAQNEYFEIDGFTVFRGEEIYVSFDYLTPEEMQDEASLGSYQMLYPGDYTVHATNYDSVLQNFMQVVGSKTVKVNPSEEDFKEYGLDAPAYTVFYKFKGIEMFVFFSKPNPDGTYYATSNMFNQVVLLDGAPYDFLKWDLISWIDIYLFQMNINDVASIQIQAKGQDIKYTLEGEKDALVVSHVGTTHKPVVQNFRQFYKTMLNVSMLGYADITEEQMKTFRESTTPYLTWTVVTDSGEETVYKFYPYSERQMYYTVNGEGQFYVLGTFVDKVINDAIKITKDETVDSDARY